MVAQKRHFAVFAHKTDCVVEKSLLYNFFMLKVSAVMLHKKSLA